MRMFAGSHPGKAGAGLFRHLGQFAPDIPCVGGAGCGRTPDRTVEGV